MIEIINCEQNSPEWFAARLGIPTASQFSTVMAKGQGKTRRTYMLKLLGERLTGEMTEGYSNAAMERGHEMEASARNAYAFESGNAPELVGFVRNGEQGASPDALIMLDGILEIKTKAPHLQLDVILKGKVPTEHSAQIQGQLWVSEREWCDFVSYWPGLPLFVKRVYRDEEKISQIKEAVQLFNEELAELENQFNAMQNAA